MAASGRWRDELTRQLSSEGSSIDPTRQLSEGSDDTLFRMEPAGLLETEHKLKNIHAYIRQDLKDSQEVTFNQWVEVVFGVNPVKFRAWTLEISRQRWFEDPSIQAPLVGYSKARNEKGRYDPYVKLCTNIIERARGNLSGIAKTRSYPINNISFVNNADREVQTIPEHGSLGASRRPDVLTVREPVALRIEEGERVTWPDIINWWELKFWRKLTAMLNAARRERGMAKLATGDAATETQSKRSRATAKKPSAKKPPTKPRKAPRRKTAASTAEESPPHVLASLKRRAQDDLLQGMSIDSDVKRQNSRDPRVSLLVGGDGAVQSGSYALELLSCTYGTRVFCTGFVIKDDRVFPWFYDASGVIHTTEFISMIADFEQFAALLVAFACCTPEQLGVMPTSIMKPHIPYPRNFPPQNLSGHIVYIQDPNNERRIRIKLQDHRFSQYSLLGRRTFLYNVQTTPMISRNDLAVKFSYQASTRTPEQDLVAIARNAGVKHLPQIHLWGDLWKLSDSTRQIFLEKSGGTAEYEDRTLRAIVYTRYSSIKTLFVERCDLIPVMVDQMLDCLHDLRYKANILHRDVSVNNIMYEMRGNKYYFILIDYDMGVVLPTAGKGSYRISSKHRTGTLPFMARALVEDAWLASRTNDYTHMRHLLCHDYESLFWISLWCPLMLPFPGLIPHHVKNLRAQGLSWELGDLNKISCVKGELITGGLSKKLGAPLPPAAACFIEWFEAWVDLLYSIRDAERAHEKIATRRKRVGLEPETTPWDAETIDGLFTRDTIKAVLTPLMPFRQPDVDEEDVASPAPEPPLREKRSKPQTRRRTPRVQPVFSDMRARLRPRK